MTIKKNSTARKAAPASEAPVKKTGNRAKLSPKAVLHEPVKLQSVAAAKLAAKKLKKEHKVKIVRDSFTMPQSEYQKIAKIKETCLKAGLHVKKSEVLRAGLKALCEKSDAQLKQALKNLEKIRTGRPKKH